MRVGKWHRLGRSKIHYIPRTLQLNVINCYLQLMMLLFQVKCSCPLQHGYQSQRDEQHSLVTCHFSSSGLETGRRSECRCCHSTLADNCSFHHQLASVIVIVVMSLMSFHVQSRRNVLVMFITSVALHIRTQCSCTYMYITLITI